MEQWLPSEGFILALIGSGGVALGVFLKFILKSRCKDIKCCCGLLHCIRDTIDLSAVEVEARSPRSTGS